MIRIFLIGKSTINGSFFTSYVSLPDVIQARHHQNVEVRGELGGCTARCPILSPFRGLASGKLT